MKDEISPHDSQQPLYLRIGDWHPSETSRNYSTGEIEDGVSVYDLTTDGSIIVSDQSEWAVTDLFERLQRDLPRYLVQGDWVGTGGDGEAVLKNLKVIGSWPGDLPERFRSSVGHLNGETIITVDEATGSHGGSHGKISPPSR